MTLRTSRAAAAVEVATSPSSNAAAPIAVGASAGAGAQWRSRNSLVELAKDYPEETSRFLLRGLILSAIAGLCVGTPCEMLIFVTWEQRTFCERPLRPWIVVAGLLHLAQFPLRFICYQRLSARQKAVDSFIDEGSESEYIIGQMIASAVSDVVLSWTWRMSQVVSCLSLGWIIVGAVWVPNCSSEPACPEVFYAGAVLVTAMVRLVFSVMSFRVTFSCDVDSQVVDREMRETEHASRSSRGILGLLHLPTKKCSLAQSTSVTGQVCAICLSSFQHRQGLRVLPCRHFFHRKCIDQWLRQKIACPLCRCEDLSSTSDEQGTSRLSHRGSATAAISIP